MSSVKQHKYRKGVYDVGSPSVELFGVEEGFNTTVSIKSVSIFLWSGVKFNEKLRETRHCKKEYMASGVRQWNYLECREVSIPLGA